MDWSRCDSGKPAIDTGKKIYRALADWVLINSKSLYLLHIPIHWRLIIIVFALVSLHFCKPVAGPIIMALGRCFDFRWPAHVSVFGLTCIPIPLSYAAHLRPICPLVSCLRAPSEKLWLCKSSPAPPSLLLSLICKSRLKWYCKAVKASLVQCEASAGQFISLED